MGITKIIKIDCFDLSNVRRRHLTSKVVSECNSVLTKIGAEKAQDTRNMMGRSSQASHVPACTQRSGNVGIEADQPA